MWCDAVQGRHERKQKVVVLRELHRAIIYTTMIDKRACDKESRENEAHECESDIVVFA